MMKNIKVQVTSIIILIGSGLLVGQTPTNKQIVGQQQVSKKWDEKKLGPAKIIIDEKRGNWYLKQEYYKKAKMLYEDVIDASDQVEIALNAFLKKQNSIISKVSTFNYNLGIESGNLEARLKEIEDELEQERTRTKGLNEEERKILLDVESKEIALEELKKKIAELNDLISAIEKVVGIAEDQQLKVKDYENKSRLLVDKIENEINDLKAKQYLAVIQTNLNNINAIEKYLGGELNDFMLKKIQETEKFIDNLKKEIDELKAMGLNIEKRAEKEEEKERKEEAEKIKKLEEELARKKAEEEKNKSFWSKIKDWFKNLFSSKKKAKK